MIRIGFGMTNISVGFGTDLSFKAIIKGIRIAIGTGVISLKLKLKDRTQSSIKRRWRSLRSNREKLKLRSLKRTRRPRLRSQKRTRSQKRKSPNQKRKKTTQSQRENDAMVYRGL